MAKVLIPTALQQYAGGTDELEIGGATVQEVLDGLAAQYPILKKQLFNDRGDLRQFVNLYKGAEDTRTLQGLATPLAADDELSIVPSIAGGTGTVVNPVEAKLNPPTAAPAPNPRAVIS